MTSQDINFFESFEVQLIPQLKKNPKFIKSQKYPSQTFA